MAKYHEVKHCINCKYGNNNLPFNQDPCQTCNTETCSNFVDAEEEE